MKLYIAFFAVLMVLVQTVFSQPTLTQDSSDNSHLKRMSSAWGKRMSSAWGKRMSSAWGKREENEHDEFFHYLLRELYRQAHLNKYGQLRFALENELNPVGYEQYSVERTISNNDDETAAGSANMS